MTIKIMKMTFLMEFILINESVATVYIINQTNIMKAIKKIKEIVTKADYFSTGQMLRYKGQQQFQNFYGGLISILIFIVLMIAFSTKIINIFTKTQITSSSSLEYISTQTPLILSDNDIGNKFMFALGTNANIYEYDYNYYEYSEEFMQWVYTHKNGYYFAPYIVQHIQYAVFDIINQTDPITNITIQRKYRNVLENTTVSYMQLCTRQHWSYYPQIQAQFIDLKMEMMFCAPKNFNFELKGSQGDYTSSYVQVVFATCLNMYNDSIFPADLPCIQDKHTGLVLLLTPKPIINPSLSNYISYILDRSNTLSFSSSVKQGSMVYIDQYKISTDQSIIPIQSLKEDSGVTVNQSPSQYQISNNGKHQLAIFNIIKSNWVRNYERSYKKLDQIIAYIGGLFGTVITAFFLFNTYNDYSFQVDLGTNLFRSNDPDCQKKKNYNVFNFFIHYLYQLLTSFNCNLEKWKSAKHYDDYQSQIVKQLDVMLILERINFLQKSISQLFSRPQITGLYLYKQYNLDEAKSLRRKYRERKKIKKMLIDTPQFGKDSNNQGSQRKGYSNSQKILEQKINTDEHNNKVTINGQELKDSNANLKRQQFQTHNQGKQKQQNQKSGCLDSIDSQEQNSVSSQTEQFNRQLFLLKEEAQLVNGSEMSKKIWNDLDDDVKEVVNQKYAQKSNENYKVSTQSLIRQNGQFYQISLSPNKLNDQIVLQSQRELKLQVFENVRNIRMQTIEINGKKQKKRKDNNEK